MRNDDTPEDIIARITVIFTAVDLIRLLAEKAMEDGGSLRGIDIHRLAVDATHDMFELLGDLAVRDGADNDGVQMNVQQRLLAKRRGLNDRPH